MTSRGDGPSSLAGSGPGAPAARASRRRERPYDRVKSGLVNVDPGGIGMTLDELYTSIGAGAVLRRALTGQRC